MYIVRNADLKENLQIDSEQLRLFGMRSKYASVIHFQCFIMTQQEQRSDITLMKPDEQHFLQPSCDFIKCCHL